jgi:hypothetical protein
VAQQAYKTPQVAYGSANIDRLAAIIRQKLRNGCLPWERAAGIFGQCAACNRELRVTQSVMELPTLDGRVFVHGDCFIIWDSERAALWPTVIRER